MCYVYILRASDNSYYIGCCNKIENRFKDHCKGKVKFTKSRLPVTLIYLEEYNDLKVARKREKQIKNWKSRKAIERLINNKPDNLPPSSSG